MRPTRRRLLWTGLCAALVLVVLGGLTIHGTLWPNRLLAAHYDVRGVDVSHHQGPIDWEALAGDDVDFAYIKATEGSSHVDDRFAANWQDARDAGLVVGAYHFMSFDSPGEDQARNLVAAVPPTPGMLPPVVDLESYGEYVDHLPDASTVRPILDDLLAALEEEYGVPPIIYTTGDVFDAYVDGAYDDNPVWIRSVLLPPHLPGGRDWTFWQYSDRDHRDGIDGGVDMDVFAGTEEEFADLRL
ncbi:GH25 family lysozyme [Nocardioides sp. MH1]|uniref:GH25 family lysozyme n=1 Tax=Nocardioides sp. MH1 TaxID=3242490 RepID=UPI0035220038